MLRIAVVDDEQEQRVLLENCLHRYEQENSQHFDISLFADAQKFLRQDPGDLISCCWTSRCRGWTG